MNIWFYGIWGIIGLLTALGGLLINGWNKEKEHNNLITSEEDVPEIYTEYIKKARRVKIVLFGIGAVIYSIFCALLHIGCYGVMSTISVEDGVRGSIGFILIIGMMMSSATPTSIPNDIQMNGLDKTFCFLKELTLSIQRGVYGLSISYEKRMYRQFVRREVHRICTDKGLKCLFLLKLKTTSWGQSLDITPDEYTENVGNKIIFAYIEDVRFQEIAYEVCTKDFIKIGAKVLDVITMFSYCTEKELEGNKTRYKEQVAQLVKKMQPKTVDDSTLPEVDKDLKLLDINEEEQIN